jgi:signal transduction histidine kinase
MVAHELRTPLSAVLGWSQLLRTPRTRDELIEGLEAIEHSARVQAQLIEDLLDLRLIMSGFRLDLRPVHLEAVLDAAAQSLRPAAMEKRISLQPLLEPDATLVLGDEGRLEQVFRNLVDNAIKFTPPKGQIKLLLRRVDGAAQVSIIDTGEGIEPQSLSHVFERLWQASKFPARSGGLGLGLAIVKQLVELHGGSVRAESDGVGHGAKFVVTLPLAGDDS